MRRLLISLTLLVLVPVAPALIMPSSASAETDVVQPDINFNNKRAGVATIYVRWAWGPAWRFSSVEVRDWQSDGYCVTPYVKLNRRYQADTGWMQLNGKYGAFLSTSYSYAVTCGLGARFYDPDGTVPYSGATPWRELTGLYGAWFRLCMTNRSGDPGVMCGPSRYAANNGS